MGMLQVRKRCGPEETRDYGPGHSPYCSLIRRQKYNEGMKRNQGTEVKGNDNKPSTVTRQVQTSPT